MNETQLSKEQENIIMEEWNSHPDDPPALLDLIKKAFPDDNFDGRSKEGRAVKAFLATREIRARGAHEYQPKRKINLSDEDKEFLLNNASVMKPLELTRVVFKDNTLSNLSQESRCVTEYLGTLPSEALLMPLSEEVNSEYKTPKTFASSLARINKYVHPPLDKDKMSPAQRKSVNSLISYLNTYRFTHQINSYITPSDRDLFESSFIRYTYDKYDLTQEEVDQYIVLSCEVVIASTVQSRVERLSNLLDNSADDSDGRRMSMSLIEAISSCQTEYNQCINRQTKLLNDLKEKRSTRLSKELKNNASILNLVEMWKEEESRKKMIKLAEIRKSILTDEIDRLTTIDELKGKILGLSEDEILNG